MVRIERFRSKFWFLNFFYLKLLVFKSFMYIKQIFLRQNSLLMLSYVPTNHVNCYIHFTNVFYTFLDFLMKFVIEYFFLDFGTYFVPFLVLFLRSQHSA